MRPAKDLENESLVKSSLSWFNNPYKVLLDASSEHGSQFYLKLPLLGKTLVTGDPKTISEIRQSPNLVGGRGMTILRPILSEESLIMMEGSDHAQRRKALAVLFTEDNIRRSDSYIRETAEKILPLYWNRGQQPVYEVLRKIFLKVIVDFIFVESHENRRVEIEHLVENFLGSFDNSAFLFIKPLQKNIPFSPWRKFTKNRAALLSAIDVELQAGRLPLMKRKGLDPKACGSEIMSLLLFGHDTAAATTAWAMYHIAQNQTVIPRFCSDDAYRDSVIYETMRLSPVVVHLTRVATQDMSIGSHRIKEGDRVLPCVYLAHHNPNSFANPHDFQADRFIDGIENFEDSFFPFGFGRRVCIGKHLAMRQMQVLLPQLYKQAIFNLPSDDRTKPVRENVIMVPSSGLKMTVIPKN